MPRKTILTCLFAQVALDGVRAGDCTCCRAVETKSDFSPAGTSDAVASITPTLAG